MGGIKNAKKLAILTSGGDSPEWMLLLEQLQREIAVSYGFEVYGIKRGYLGMLNDEILS